MLGSDDMRPAVIVLVTAVSLGIEDAGGAAEVGVDWRGVGGAGEPRVESGVEWRDDERLSRCAAPFLAMIASLCFFTEQDPAHYRTYFHYR